jgi:phenylpyruvate tautomerase PptA (4-oxalocrotonate tautomerase family)
MPIVDIEIVLRPGEILRGSLAQELADGIGAALGAPEGSTWVKVRGLAREQYAESGGAPDDVHPVFVSILKSALPSPEQMKGEVESLVQVVSQICERPPENVHLVYQPEGRGRAAFGGRLV